MRRQSQTLRLEGVGKVFPGVKALEGITLDVSPGEIHAIMGENGAGKSTLMNILSGVYQPDEGEIILGGQPMQFRDTRHAQEQGIAMIHQELSLLNHLSVAENIYSGRLPKNTLGFVDGRMLRKRATEALGRLGVCDFHADTQVAELSTSQMQLVEIAKALSLESSILIMDEPTSSLTAGETETLLGLMRSLSKEGVSVLFISHRVDEVFAVADRLTVLRDGRLIATKTRSQCDKDEVLSLMVGRAFDQSFRRNRDATRQAKEPVLQVQGLTSGRAVRDVSLSVRAGEILALTGLVGAGRTETVETIFGARGKDGGSVRIEGKEVTIKHPADAVGLGLALVPEGRKLQGIFPELSVKQNMTVAHLPALTRALFIKGSRETQTAEDYAARLAVKTPSLAQKIKYLSGGNQQKAIFCRWLMNEPKVLFLDEPTHGIDVGAKEEIYRIIDSLAARGVAIVLISSELPEVLTLADRILVMREGQVVAELDQESATQEEILRHAVSRASCA